MKRVVAAVDRSPVTELVRSTAHAIADVLDLEVEEIASEVGDDADPARDEAAAVCAALAGDDVVVGVLGARRLRSRHQPLGHVAAAAITNAEIPLVVVPPDAQPLRPTGQLTLLAPLDGTASTERAIRAAVTDVIGALGDLIVLHVFDETSVPMFVTSAEDRRILAEEWAHRHGAGSVEPAELRLGRPAETVLDMVGRAQPDGLVLGWHRRLDDGHGEVVRRAIAEAGVPIILIPVDES